MLAHRNVTNESQSQLQSPNNDRNAISGVNSPVFGQHFHFLLSVWGEGVAKVQHHMRPRNDRRRPSNWANFRAESSSTQQPSFLSAVFIGYCDYHLVTCISDIVTIFPIPKANFGTAALLPCDCLLGNSLDIVTIYPSSRGSHKIR